MLLQKNISSGKQTPQKQNTVTVSITHKLIGKPQNPGTKTTYNLKNICWTPDELIAHIVSGKAFAVAQYKNGHRKSDNFIQSNLIAVDVDGETNPLNENEWRILLATPFIVDYAFAVIQTASSQPGAYKARVLFRLSETITDAEQYKMIARIVAGKIPGADLHATDAARAFYGGQPGRRADFVNVENTLPLDLLTSEIGDALKKMQSWQQIAPISYIKPDADHVRAYVDGAIKNELDNLQTAHGNGNNALFRAACNLGGFVASGYLNQGEIENLLLNTPVAQRRSEHEARATIASGLKRAQPRTVPPLSDSRRRRDMKQLEKILVEEPPDLLPPDRFAINPKLTERILSEAKTRGLEKVSTDGSSVIIDDRYAPIRELCDLWNIDFRELDGIYQILPIQRPTSSINVDERFITNTEEAQPQKSQVTLIKSAVGTGKTELIFSTLRDFFEENPHQRVLIISHRIALAYQQSQREPELDFVCYHADEEKENLGRHSRLVISPNSLHKLIDDQGRELLPYDIVIIDENESVCEHITGATLREGNRAHNALNILQTLTRRAGTVIAADANAGSVSYNLLNRNRPGEVVVIENSYTPQRGAMNNYADENDLIRALVADLNQAQSPILVACDSRDRVKTLHNVLSEMGHNGRTVHGNNSSETETIDFLSHINERLPELDYLIYTSSMGTGIDIQAEVHAVYGFFSNQSVSVEEQFQMLGRARQAAQFNVYTAYRLGLAENDSTALRAELKQTHLENEIRRIHQGSSLIHFEENAKVELTLTSIQQDFLDLWADVKSKLNQYSNTPYEYFWHFAQQEYDVTYIPSKNLKEDVIRELMRETRKRRKAEERTLILNCPPVDEKTYRHAKIEGTLTPEIEAGYIRRVIQQEYGTEGVTPELLAHFEKKGVEKLKAFIDLHRDLEEIKERDRIENLHDRPLPYREWDTSKMIILHILLWSIWGDELHTDEIPDDEFQDRLRIFDQLYDALNVDRVFKRHHTASKDPARRLRWVLSHAGLMLERVRHGKYKNRISWRIESHSYTQMQEMACQRMEARGERVAVDRLILKGDVFMRREYSVIFRGNLPPYLKKLLRERLRPPEPAETNA